MKRLGLVLAYLAMGAAWSRHAVRSGFGDTEPHHLAGQVLAWPLGAAMELHATLTDAEGEDWARERIAASTVTYRTRYGDKGRAHLVDDSDLTEGILWEGTDYEARDAASDLPVTLWYAYGATPAWSEKP